MAKILVVDDSPSVLALIQAMLVEAGHNVIPSSTARDALRIANETAVDVIVTDIYMPDKDGLEFLADARILCPDIPAIAISGAKDSKNILTIAKRLGAALTLQKPFSKEQLLHAVNVVIGVIAPEEKLTGECIARKA